MIAPHAQKSPASPASDPGHGSTQTCNGKAMNNTQPITAAPQAASCMVDAAYVNHLATDVAGSLSNIISTLQFCERLVCTASDDQAMKDETKRDLVSIAHVLAMTSRAIEWEIAELEKLAASAQAATRRRALA